MNLIGVDPGKKTGVAHFDGRQFRAWELQRLDVLTHVRGLVGDRTTHIAIERFIIGTGTGKKTQQPDALEIIGSLVELEREEENISLLRQNAADAKHAAPDVRLRAVGWYATRMGHANDAARHVWLLLLRFFPERALSILDRVG